MGRRTSPEEETLKELRRLRPFASLRPPWRKKKRPWVRYTAIALLAAACVGAAELTACRFLEPALYETLMELLRLQGVRTVYGLVASPNPASEGLHAALGFRVMGVQRKAGYKNGRWIDLLWFERAIASYDPDPAPLIPVSNLPQEAVRAALNSF